MLHQNILHRGFADQACSIFTLPLFTHIHTRDMPSRTMRPIGPKLTLLDSKVCFSVLVPQVSLIRLSWFWSNVCVFIHSCNVKISKQWAPTEVTEVMSKWFLNILLIFSIMYSNIKVFGDTSDMLLACASQSGGASVCVWFTAGPWRLCKLCKHIGAVNRRLQAKDTHFVSSGVEE